MPTLCLRLPFYTPERCPTEGELSDDRSPAQSLGTVQWLQNLPSHPRCVPNASVYGASVLVTEEMTAKISALGEYAAIQATFARPPPRHAHCPAIEEDAFQVTLALSRRDVNAVQS